MAIHLPSAITFPLQLARENQELGMGTVQNSSQEMDKILLLANISLQVALEVNKNEDILLHAIEMS